MQGRERLKYLFSSCCLVVVLLSSDTTADFITCLNNVEPRNKAPCLPLLLLIVDTLKWTICMIK